MQCTWKPVQVWGQGLSVGCFWTRRPALSERCMLHTWLRTECVCVRGFKVDPVRAVWCSESVDLIKPDPHRACFWLRSELILGQSQSGSRGRKQEKVVSVRLLSVMTCPPLCVLKDFFKSSSPCSDIQLSPHRPALSSELYSLSLRQVSELQLQELDKSVCVSLSYIFTLLCF